MRKFISIPSKRGYVIDIKTPISRYILKYYGGELHRIHFNSMNEFNDMRSDMLYENCQKQESTIAALSRYYDQFVSLAGKIPIEENEIRIDFKWEDAFGKDKMFKKKNYLQMASGEYERICVLFNIAALYSQIAVAQNIFYDDALKNAAKYYQQAAGIFSYLESTASAKCIATNDLHPDTLRALSVLMLSQAQELMYIKAATYSGIREENIAKIVKQVSDLYWDTLTLMELDSIKSIWPKEWIPFVADKHVSFHAVAEYYQAKSCGSLYAFGEQISRLQKATELMKTASSRAGLKFMFRTEQERIKKDLETIEKKNNLIYHESIPDVASLSPISKAVLVRELPLENTIDKDFKDLFDKIVPLAMHRAIVMFKKEQKVMVNSEVFRLKEATNTLGTILASLNLPAALDDSKDDSLPNTLLEKSAALRNKGGITKIDEMLNSLPKVLQRNEEILNESTRMLNDEETSDNTLKEQFKDRWNRTPSAKLTETWRAEANKFNNILQQAKSSDDVIRKIYQEHSPQIRILSQNEAVIKQSIPKSAGSDKSSSDPHNIKKDVRQTYEEIQSMIEIRSVLIDEIGNNEGRNFGIQVTKALTEDGFLGQEDIVELNRAMEPFKERVQESLNFQEHMLYRLQEKCSQLGGSDSSSQERAAVIFGLMLSIEKYHELTNNLEEGLKFYGNLTEILLKFQIKVKDFCFARKTEKDKLMKDIQFAIVPDFNQAPRYPDYYAYYPK